MSTQRLTLAQIAFKAHWRDYPLRPEWNKDQHERRWTRTARAVELAIKRRAKQ